jgi:hypothetical protein
MSRRSTATSLRPTDKATVMTELREVLLGNACQLMLSTGEDQLAETYLGVSLGEYSFGSMPGGFRDDIKKIDLTRFYIASQIEAAYDFALQEGDTKARTAFTNDDWNDLEIFSLGAAQCSFGGEPTPLGIEDSSLRRTFDMVMARMALRESSSLTIRELALLADIGETAVRTALSADGIRTEGKPAQVSVEVAEPWLRRRRGYVPTLEFNSEMITSEIATAVDAFLYRPFRPALIALMDLRGVDTPKLAHDADVDELWLHALITGGNASCDLDALGRLAVCLEVGVPLFTGRAVEAILAQI